nr:hypothetical protein [Anaerolineae bacterium]
MRKRQPTISIAILILPVILAACATDNPPALPTATLIGTPQPTATSLFPTPSPTLLPSPAPEESATPDLLPGWMIYSDNAMGLSLFRPEGWEATPALPGTISIYENDGEGWIEFGFITPANSNPWGIDYVDGMDSGELLAATMMRLAEDGTFGEPWTIITRQDLTFQVVEGTYHVFREQMIVAVMALDERALVILAHGPEPSEDPPEGEWDRLSATYQQIIWSVTLLQD